MNKTVTAALQHALNEVDSFLTYAVSPEDHSDAMKFVRSYEKDGTALRLFREHYSALPDALEEPIVALYELASHQGVRCLLATSENGRFVYVVSSDKVIYIGCSVDMFSDDLLKFIDKTDRKLFAKELEELKGFVPYLPVDKEGSTVCPTCGAAEGDVHLLGCLTEVCPWCDGQLSKCNCRFEKIGVDEITTEEQVEKFEALLAEKGRVPFAKEQAISFPGLSSGFDLKNK